MKATELKIGDLVRYKGKPAKVHSIPAPFIYLFDVADVGYRSSDGDENLIPLPLTTEILEKNGWKKDRDNNYIDYDHHLVLCEKSNGYALYKVINGNIIWLMNIDYVHQLQHLLWALEIDDDLKI